MRPKDDRQPRAVGAVYIDRETGEVVRMAFSFTRAALIDKDLEDVSVVLENALIEGRFWLPRRQEIEIRRTGSWLDYPARGIIRGRWEICCYQVNKGIPASYFTGPEIVLAPPSEQAQRPFPFVGSVLDSLPPDVRAVTDEDVERCRKRRARSFASRRLHAPAASRFPRDMSPTWRGSIESKAWGSAPDSCSGSAVGWRWRRRAATGSATRR